MNELEGTDLRRYQHSFGGLDVDHAVSIAFAVALLLGDMHRQNTVHGDVKPRNIVLLVPDGKIALMPTPKVPYVDVRYYAPEQVKGEAVTPATDVYSLGVVLYELLTERVPFYGEGIETAVAMQHLQEAPTPPRQLNPGIPPDLQEIVLRCLEKVPEKRFRDGSELAEALSGFQLNR